jgi:hypothetical protein
VSINGFSQNVIQSLAAGKAIRTLFIDGGDIMIVLEGGVFQGSCRLKLKFMPPFFPQDPVLVFLD